MFYRALKSSGAGLDALCILMTRVRTIGTKVTRITARVTITDETRMTRSTKKTSLQGGK